MKIACEVIIPTVSGKTRLPWKAGKMNSWENATAFLFGGISPLAIGVVGKWRDPRGKLVPDPQNRYEIAVSNELVDELHEYIKFTCAHFEQECIYFKVGNNVEYLDNPLGWS